MRLASILRRLLPVMERVGVATAAGIEIDGMARRPREEAVAPNACVMLPHLVGAWAHIL
jgi:hypothetical protein